MEALHGMSQHCITNAMYKLRFGTHNNQGIHGACPTDMLHALLLGIFRHTRDCFSSQLAQLWHLLITLMLMQLNAEPFYHAK